ncbi:MAG TPA: hypothetical protein VJN94_13375 [Candidatus Binataceae bacterium]|nr:hypothetical protein [Candidatus Binataceae bacterium]
MNGKTRIGIAAGAALLIAAAGGVTGTAMAKQGPKPPSGNLNLRFAGFELVNSDTHLDLNGIGQLIADSAGSFSGAETFTAVNPALPSSAASETVCNGTSNGTITAPTGGFGSGSGDFSISLNYTPASGSGSNCIASTTSFECSRTLEHVALEGQLDAGQYHCIVTGVSTPSGSASTIDGASMQGSVDSVRGTNAPTS